MSIAAAKTYRLVPTRVLLWPGLSLCAASVAWLYHPLGVALVQSWSQDDNYSHGPLVVLAAFGLAIHALRGRPVDAHSVATTRDVAFGLAMLLLALLIHGVAWLLDFTLLDVVSLVTLLLAIVLACGGRGLRRELGFPILILLFAAPLPVAWYQPLALSLQKLVSASAATVFSLCGLSVYREGYVIQLSGMALEVGAACSGMRQLTAYLALGAVIGHLARRGRGFTWCLIALGAAMAVAANLLRILLTGLIMLTLGPQAAAGVFHTLEGLATLAIGAAGLLAGAVLLARWQDRHSTHHAPRDESAVGSRQDLGTQHGTGDGISLPGAIGIKRRACHFLEASRGRQPVEASRTVKYRDFASPEARLQSRPPKTLHARSVMGTLHAPRASIATALVVGILVLAAAIQSVAMQQVTKYSPPSQMPLVAPLNQLPRQLGPWHGTDAPPPANTAWADQFVRRDYRHSQTGQIVIVWIAYSQVGADRTHHPEICMDVAGRAEDRGGRSGLSLPGGPPIAELVFGRPGDALRTWYWHYALPQTRAENYNLLVQTYHRARRRRASVTVEVVSADGGPAGQAAARELVGLIDAALHPLLPPGATRGSQRLPVGVTALNKTNRTKRTDGTYGTTDPIRPIGPIRPIKQQLLT